MTLPEHILAQVEDFAAKKKLTASEKKKLIERVKKWLEEAKIEYWEAVGLVAAESMSEPATQATLRTFHFAGAAEVSVTSGVDRMLEIADALRKIKTPSMKIYLKEPYKSDEGKAREFAISLQETVLSDIAKISEDYFAKEIYIEFDEKELENRGLTKEEVIKKIEAKARKKGTDAGDVFVLSWRGEEIPLAKLRKLRIALEKLQVSGVKGIRFALVGKEGDEFVINTSGTNLRAVLKLKEVDHTRTYSNDIHEVAAALGIEAARYMIIEELKKAYGDMDVDLRHFSLLADLLTYEGYYEAVGRTGIAGKKGSVFARAAFEETGKHLTEAALWGEEEHLKGVVENLIVGLPVKVGTGMVKLVMKLGD
ncbi:MAG TPA: DNA-directed RNA polymerase subunit A'' [Euryarchaeota archaeon]|nr:DNA-directed RNA polymerase subunit A'' [Euryarchaeota archaeon]HIQ10207.1 DNA-directed RNA polymerase subunit A'' [Euryarchaeota archaeon]